MTTNNARDDILHQPKRPFTPTTLDDVAGCLKYEGVAKTTEEMETAVQQGVIEAWHDSKRA